MPTHGACGGDPGEIYWVSSNASPVWKRRSSALLALETRLYGVSRGTELRCSYVALVRSSYASSSLLLAWLVAGLRQILDFAAPYALHGGWEAPIPYNVPQSGLGSITTSWKTMSENVVFLNA